MTVAHSFYAEETHPLVPILVLLQLIWRIPKFEFPFPIVPRTSHCRDFSSPNATPESKYQACARGTSTVLSIRLNHQ